MWHPCFDKMASYTQRRRRYEEGSKRRLYMQDHGWAIHYSTEYMHSHEKTFNYHYSQCLSCLLPHTHHSWPFAFIHTTKKHSWIALSSLLIPCRLGLLLRCRHSWNCKMPPFVTPAVASKEQTNPAEGLWVSRSIETPDYVLAIEH